MSFRGGQPMGGSFTIDMNSIENHNIEESGMRQVLVDHLKSDDFFHVERYPEAVFQIKTIVAIPGAAAGGLNYKIVGTLQLKDATNELELAASGGVDAEGRFVAQAHFDFDRTLWNVVYGSGRLFEKLGMHLVNDLISLQLKIVA
ncbi:MAG: YceI family protein [Verrucomicrobiia bacterium]